uniref:Gustatory receptor n=1 Tax=Ditylenchus dipsaci TaxID=166011 RepID=A0A915E416_9BILA
MVFSFLIILVLPLDVSITFYKKCLLDESILNNVTISNAANTQNISLECEEPKGHVPDDTLLGLWRLVYWTSQLLTWVVLPILQSYSKAGEFTTLGRLKSAVYNNLIYYGTYGCIFFFLLVYAISKGVSLNFDHLKVLVISASNTWGLFLLVLLLGYGLIEVPRQLWQMGDRGYRLSKTYFDIDKLSIDKNDAEETIQEVYREAKEVMNVLKGTRGNAREKAQQIMSKFPHDLSRQLNSSRSAPNFGNSSNITDADASVISNEAYLVSLHFTSTKY